MAGGPVEARLSSVLDSTPWRSAPLAKSAPSESACSTSRRRAGQAVGRRDVFERHLDVVERYVVDGLIRDAKARRAYSAAGQAGRFVRGSRRPAQIQIQRVEHLLAFVKLGTTLASGWMRGRRIHTPPSFPPVPG